MEVLKTTDTGGFPYVLDDMRWIASGISNAFKGAISALTNGNDCKLVGCVITITSFSPFTITYTSGYIFINGEICYVPALTTPTVISGTAFWWDNVTSFDPAGLKTFEDAGVHNTYQKNLGLVVGGASIPTGRLSASSGLPPGQNLSNQLAILIANEQLLFTDYIKFGFDAGATLSSSIITSDFYNSVILGFDGTVPNIRGGDAGQVGALVIMKMKATTSTKTIILNHNDSGITAPKRFWTRTGTNILLNDGDSVVMSFDGNYWNILSEHNSPVAALSSLTFQNGWASNTPIAQYSKQGKIVTLQGSAFNSAYTSSSTQLIIVLPVGYRPTDTRVFRVYDSTSSVWGFISIDPSGSVAYAEAGLTGANVAFYLEGISFLTN